MTLRRFLIFLSFGTLLVGTESRTNLNGLMQSEDKKFDDLLRNVFLQNEHHRREEKQANLISQLAELSSTPDGVNGQHLTNKSSDVSNIFDAILGKSGDEGNSLELFQKTKDDDFRNLDKNIKKEVLPLSTLQRNEALADLYSLLAPYIGGKSGAGDQEKLYKNEAAENEVKHTSQVDVKVLKSRTDANKQTGTKFFDSRPNMTDLLNNIRNITKSKQDQTSVRTVAARFLQDPFNIFREQDLYYGPTATYGCKETYSHSAAKENTLGANQRTSELTAKQTSRFDDSNLQAHNSQDESSFTKTGRKMNRSVKIRKRNNSMADNSSKTVSKVPLSSPKSSNKNSEFLGVGERSGGKTYQKSNSKQETHDGSGEEYSEVKKMDFKTEEITALTARIVADIVKEIDKRYRHECESEPAKGATLTKKMEDHTGFLNPDLCSNSSKRDQSNSKFSDQIDKGKKEEYNTLKSLNFPVVTTKSITKPAGIPLYKIPNTEIYIYDLYSANKSAHAQMKITDQSDLASILDQLVATDSPDGNYKNRLGESVLAIDPNESFLHQSIFDKNLLPDFFDSLIQSKSEAAKEKGASKFTDIDSPITYTSDSSQVIPEIEIHIRTVPLGSKNASNVDLSHKKPIFGRRDPFSDILLFNGRSQKNSKPTSKTPYQRKVIGQSQHPPKKNTVLNQQPKLDSDDPQASKKVRSFFGLKAR
nr:PREDICTED: uncharacterized protein LOC109037605 [Bemisia tabaci]